MYLETLEHFGAFSRWENQCILCFCVSAISLRVGPQKSTFHLAVLPVLPAKPPLRFRDAGWPRPAWGRGVDRVIPGDGPSMRPPDFVIRVVCEGVMYEGVVVCGCVVLGLPVWCMSLLLVLLMNPSLMRVTIGSVCRNDHISADRGMFRQSTATLGKRLFTFSGGVLLVEVRSARRPQGGGHPRFSSGRQMHTL